MSIDDVAADLYALAPEEFTAARNARAKEAKAAGDAELAARVQSLRKPTAGAWLLNQLVRQHADDVQQVLELGGQLRAAQGTLGADELRALDRQRRQLTRAVAEQAAGLGRDAGRRVTAATTAEVEESLRSAMVDAVAGAALATGLLTDTFSSTGLGPVDLSRVVALPPDAAAASTPPASTASEPAGDADAARRRRVADAERALAEAESTLETARKVLAQAEQDATEAQERRERLAAEREEARRRLDDLDARLAGSTEAAEAAAGVQHAAQREESSAAKAAARLRERLGELKG
ncbi:MAG: transposase [Ornithinibacter sp.]